MPRAEEAAPAPQETNGRLLVTAAGGVVVTSALFIALGEWGFGWAADRVTSSFACHDSHLADWLGVSCVALASGSIAWLAIFVAATWYLWEAQRVTARISAAGEEDRAPKCETACGVVAVGLPKLVVFATGVQGSDHHLVSLLLGLDMMVVVGLAALVETALLVMQEGDRQRTVLAYTCAGLQTGLVLSIGLFLCVAAGNGSLRTICMINISVNCGIWFLASVMTLGSSKHREGVERTSYLSVPAAVCFCAVINFHLILLAFLGNGFTVGALLTIVASNIGLIWGVNIPTFRGGATDAVVGAADLIRTTSGHHDIVLGPIDQWAEVTCSCLSITSIGVAAIVLHGFSSGSLAPYTPVCMVVPLVVYYKSPGVILGSVFMAVACWWHFVAPEILLVQYVYCALTPLTQRGHLLGQVPTLLYVLLLMGAIKVRGIVQFAFGVVLLCSTFCYAVLSSWHNLNQRGFTWHTLGVGARADNQAISFWQWLLLYEGLFTTGVLALLTPKKSLSIALFVIVGLASLLLLAFAPSCSRPVSTGYLSAAVSGITDLGTLLYVVIFDIFSSAGHTVEHVEGFRIEHSPYLFGSLFGCIFAWKSVKFMYLVILETFTNGVFRKTGETNDGINRGTSWVTWKNDAQTWLGWSFVLVHSALVTWSIRRGVAAEVDESDTDLEEDTGLFSAIRAWGPHNMAAIDSAFFLIIVMLYMLFASQYLKSMKGKTLSEGGIYRLESRTKVFEALLQLMLNLQVLYAVFRARMHLDPLYVMFAIADVIFILLLMLSRQLAEDGGCGCASKYDWFVMFALESIDVFNILVITVTLNRDGYDESIQDKYMALFVFTLLLFQLTYPWWTSLKRICAISIVNDIFTDGPMIGMMVVYELWDGAGGHKANFWRTIAGGTNALLILFGVVVWPAKFCFTNYNAGRRCLEGAPSPSRNAGNSVDSTPLLGGGGATIATAAASVRPAFVADGLVATAAVASAPPQSQVQTPGDDW